MEAAPVSDSELEWCNYTTLDSNELTLASNWIYSMDAEYYNLFSKDKEKILNLIQDLLKTTDTEFGTTLFIRNSGILAGFATWFNSDELFSRRILVLKKLMGAADDKITIKTRLMSFIGANNIVPKSNLYLSKIYVRSEMRGSGLAKKLLMGFMYSAKKSGLNMILHVSRMNLISVSFYTSNGFGESINPSYSNTNYILMEKSK